MQVETDRPSGIDYLERLKPRIRLATAADIDWLWEKAKLQTSIFHEPGPDEERQFKSLLLLPDTLGFIVDGGALAFFTAIVPNHRAYINLIIWDERLYAQYDLARDVINFMFNALKLQRIDAAIPSDNVLGRNYAEQLGFQLEGRIRRGIARPDEGRFADTLFYGLLKEEYYGLGSGSTVRVQRVSDPGRESPVELGGRQRRRPRSSLRGGEAAGAHNDRSAVERHPRSRADVDGGDASVPKPSWSARFKRAWRAWNARGDGVDGGTNGHIASSASEQADRLPEY